VVHVRDFDEQLLVAVARQHIDPGGGGGLLTSPAQHSFERLRFPGVEALRLPEVDEFAQIDLQPTTTTFTCQQTKAKAKANGRGAPVAACRLRPVWRRRW
jgi:hypothetical protein